MVQVYGYLQQENSGYIRQENEGRLIIDSSTDGIPVTFVWCSGPMQFQSKPTRQSVDDEVNVEYPFDGNTYITQTICVAEWSVIPVPEGATSVIIRPPANNTTAMWLCGEVGDTGVQMHLTLPQYVPLA